MSIFAIVSIISVVSAFLIYKKWKSNKNIRTNSIAENNSNYDTVKTPKPENYNTEDDKGQETEIMIL